MLSEQAPCDGAVSEALLDCLRGEAGLALAVSGGPDSMALLRLADSWRRSVARPPLYAATVDHGLREQSRAEAEQVGLWCRELGIAHEILEWRGEKPTARLQERARAARYALLEEFARRKGASCLLTAHHADDQVETILFRFLRGSSVAGLAGMRRRRPLGSITQARPLLSVWKRDLEAYCESLGQAFLRDPSNADPRFARARLRRVSNALTENGFPAPDLLRLGRRAARCEAALQAGYACFKRALPLQEGPRRAMARDVFAEAPEEFVIRWIIEGAAELTGAAPRLERVESVIEALRGALDSGSRLRRTIGGLVCDLSLKELALAPETPRKPRSRRSSGGEE